MNEPSASPATETLLSVAIRFALFSVAVVGLILTIWSLAQVDPDDQFSEGSPLEWVQLGILLVTMVVFAMASRNRDAFRQLFVLLAFLPALASIRELDRDFDRLLPGLGWQLPFVVVLVPALVHFIRNRRAIASQVRAFVVHRSFSLLWSGFIVAVPFAQMIGHGEFLERLFGDDYERLMKRLVEESTEALGYLLILLGSIDLACSARRMRPAE